MDCLANLLSLPQACAANSSSSSGLSLNTLAGLTVKNLEASLNDEYADAYALISAKFANACELMKNEAQSYFADKVREASLLEDAVLGNYYDNIATEPASNATYKGIQLRYEDFGHSEVLISSVRLRVHTSGATNIYVIDLITGLILDTIPITAVADSITEIFVNKTYKAHNKRLNLLICYNATGLVATQTPLYHSGYTGRSECCGKYMGMYGCNVGGYGYIYAMGAYISTATTASQANLLSLGHTAGLSINYSLICSVEPLICSMASRLAWPLLHLTGVLLLEEMLYSKRLNSIITLGQKDHKELIDLYQHRYDVAMTSVFKNINIPNDVCYTCNPKVKAVTQIP